MARLRSCGSRSVRSTPALGERPIGLTDAPGSPTWSWSSPAPSPSCAPPAPSRSGAWIRLAVTHLNEVIMIMSSIAVVMTGLMMLTAVVTFDIPVERSTAWATILARWWRTFRLALLLAVGPGLIALALATARAAVRVADDSRPCRRTFRDFAGFDPGYRLDHCRALGGDDSGSGCGDDRGQPCSSSLDQSPQDSPPHSARACFWSRHSPGLFSSSRSVPLDPSGGPSPFVAGLSMMSFLWATSTLVAQLVTHQPRVVGIAEWSAVWVVLLTLFTIGTLWLTSRMLTNAAVESHAHELPSVARYAKCFSLPHSTRSTPLPGD